MITTGTEKTQLVGFTQRFCRWLKTGLNQARSAQKPTDGMCCTEIHIGRMPAVRDSAGFRGGLAMTDLQYSTIYEMWRQGLHQRADLARRCWSRGKDFELETWVLVPSTLRRLLAECNREAHARVTH